MCDRRADQIGISHKHDRARWRVAAYPRIDPKALDAEAPADRRPPIAALEIYKARYFETALVQAPPDRTRGPAPISGYQALQDHRGG
jgi:hypothetical protein